MSVTGSHTAATPLIMRRDYPAADPGRGAAAEVGVEGVVVASASVLGEPPAEVAAPAAELAVHARRQEVGEHRFAGADQAGAVRVRPRAGEGALTGGVWT